MKLLIEIDKGLYDRIKCLEPQDILSKAIANGTPLPEHHSELVDKREVYKKFYCRSLAHVAGEVLSEVSTIIPATKEGGGE